MMLVPRLNTASYKRDLIPRFKVWFSTDLAVRGFMQSADSKAFGVTYQERGANHFAPETLLPDPRIMIQRLIEDNTSSDNLDDEFRESLAIIRANCRRGIDIGISAFRC